MWRINSSYIGYFFFIILTETGKISFNLQFKHLGFLNYQNSRIEQGGLDFTKMLLMNGVGIESTHCHAVF